MTFSKGLFTKSFISYLPKHLHSSCNFARTLKCPPLLMRYRSNSSPLHNAHWTSIHKSPTITSIRRFFSQNYNTNYRKIFLFDMGYPIVVDSIVWHMVGTSSCWSGSLTCYYFDAIFSNALTIRILILTKSSSYIGRIFLRRKSQPENFILQAVNFAGCRLLLKTLIYRGRIFLYLATDW